VRRVPAAARSVVAAAGARLTEVAVTGWVGAVLTGGASTRMGRDKASIPVDGVAMAVRVAEALLAAGAARVACIGPAVGALPAVADDHPGEGPLGGVLTAARWAAGAVVVVAPCDLLHPDPAAFAALAAAADPVAAALAARPLPMAVAAPARASLEAAFAGGERSIRGALAASGVHVAEVALAPEALADADAPGDLPEPREGRNRGG
jgi:molybdopterin-guanine dinucleotide biosynthesis protein A